MFYPSPDRPWTQEHPVADDWMVDAAPGVQLRLRHYPGPDDAPTILFFHGNGETARDYDGIAPAYNSMPATLVIAEYRGYGPSTGEPNLLTYIDDAHVALDEVLRRLADEGRPPAVVVMGRSMGSGPAIELAAHRADDLAGLVVESGFAWILPSLERNGVPVQELGLTEEHGPNNEAKMARVELPTLVIHARNDELLPLPNGERLFEVCRDPGKAMLSVPGAGHNDIQYVAGKDYFIAIRDLLVRITGAG